jgi:hypothetical protein
VSIHTTSRYVVTVTTCRLVAISPTDVVGWRGSLGKVSETVTCDFCGTSAPAAETLTWTTAVENGRRRTFCDSCSRSHLRAMEGKLDSEWW